MQNLSAFQLIVLGICGILLAIGVVVFATLNRFNGNQVGTVVIWGALPQAAMDGLLQQLRSSDKSLLNTSYVEKNPATFDTELLNSIANGSAPDLVMLSQDDLAQFSDKIQPIPYATVSQSNFQSSFIDEANLFLSPQGVLAMPFMLDPLVMYWNTDLFAGAGIATPPAYWDDALADVPKLAVLTPSKDIQKSAIAMGAWNNVPNAKAILSALIMQAGDPIVSANAQGKSIPTLGALPQASVEVPASSALRFYTDFVDPSKDSYSWNRTLPSAPEAFAAGNAAIYIGFASEYAAIAARNPNLHFSVAEIPQARSEATPLTYGRLTGLAIPRGAKNYAGAAIIAQILSGDTAESQAAQSLNLPPVRRDLIKTAPNNAAQTVFNQSALIAHGWLDPSPSATNGIFRDMIEWVLSGKYQPTEAVSNAALAFQRLFQ